MVMRLFLRISVLVQLLEVIAASTCVFPAKWRGTWYQSRLGEIEISAHIISPKGHCVGSEGNKYLLLDQGRLCFMCLVFTPQHDNLLQFKESYCVEHDGDLKSVCGRITGDEILHTIVKVPSIPVPCPFQGRYLFSYTNDSSEECVEPLSEVHACADKSRFMFHYRQCPGVYGTNTVRRSFQCLAKWFNGENFLYAKFAGSGMVEREQMYRCFMYSFWGQGGQMSMSAEASCRGLQSPNIGTNTLTLTQDVDRWPHARCEFPAMLTSITSWRDIGGSYRLDVSEDRREFTITDIVDPDFLRYGEDETQTRLLVKCISVVNKGPALHQEINLLTHTTNDSCKSTYQCLRLKSRATPVMEMYLGVPSNDQYKACDEINFALAAKHVLIPMQLKPIPCPFPGTYAYVEKMSDCAGKINVGCEDETQMVVEASCPNGLKSVDVLQCYFNWTESETQVMYIIASQPGGSRHVADCLAYRTSVDGFVIQGQNDCGGGRLKVMSRPIDFIIHSKPEKCEVKQTPVMETQNVQQTEATSQIINASAGSLRPSLLLPTLLLLLALRLQR